MKITPFMAYRKPINYEGLLKLDLQFFAEGDPPPTDPPGGDPPSDPPATPPAADPVKTFTQEDVNKIAAREAKTAQEKFLKDLGIDDFKNAKEGMTKFKEWQDSQKTEAQKKEEQFESLQTNFNSINDENSTLKAKLGAFSEGVTDEKNLEAVIALAKTRVSEEVDINAAIKSVVADFPHFAGEAQQQDPETPPKWTKGNNFKQKNSELEQLEDALKNSKNFAQRIAIRNKITALQSKG